MMQTDVLCVCLYIVVVNGLQDCGQCSAVSLITCVTQGIERVAAAFTTTNQMYDQAAQSGSQLLLFRMGGAKAIRSEGQDAGVNIVKQWLPEGLKTQCPHGHME